MPIGITKSRDKYLARLSKKDEQGKNIRVRLGLFKTPKEAFIAYKSAKEAYIKSVADDYFSKGLISARIREAMYLWTVDIED